MNIGQLEKKAESGPDPVDGIRLKLLGTRANGASASKGYFYLALAGVTLAIISQYTSVQWAKYAQSNYKPNYIYMDPSGSAFLVETPRNDQPIVSEEVIRSCIWRVARFHFEVNNNSGIQTNVLTKYYLDGDAFVKFRQDSTDPNILGTSAEKAQLIDDDCFRQIELQSLRLPKKTKLDNGAYQISAELMFYTRTFKHGSGVPHLRRAYRVWYEFTIMGPLKSLL